MAAVIYGTIAKDVSFGGADHDGCMLVLLL
jgi:hypothetical protein